MSEICRFSRGEGCVICGYFLEEGYVPEISENLKTQEVSLRTSDNHITDLCSPALEAGSDDLNIIAKKQRESGCAGYAKN